MEKMKKAYAENKRGHIQPIDSETKKVLNSQNGFGDDVVDSVDESVHEPRKRVKRVKT